MAVPVTKAPEGAPKKRGRGKVLPSATMADVSRVKVRKVGYTVVLTVPLHLLTRLGWKVGESLDVRLKEGRLQYGYGGAWVWE